MDRGIENYIPSSVLRQNPLAESGIFLRELKKKLTQLHM